MQKEKIIKNLLKQARQVKVDISPENLKELDLNSFYKQKGEVYYNDNTFYKKAETGWFMVKIGTSDEEEQDNLNIKTEKREITKISSELVKWCEDFKNYVDNRLEEIEEKNEEGLREIKEYIDNLKGG